MIYVDLSYQSDLVVFPSVDYYPSYYDYGCYDCGYYDVYYYEPYYYDTYYYDVYYTNPTIAIADLITTAIIYSI